jgi:hypothetical protein
MRVKRGDVGAGSGARSVSDSGPMWPAASRGGGDGRGPLISDRERWEVAVG